MKCIKCGREIDNGVAFCPYCGEKTAGKESAAGESGPIYTAEVKGLMKSGQLAVYRDRTELITSSVQKAVYDYSALVAVKKGLDRIQFITEDGRTESCVVSRKNIHEAFLYIEKAVQPYIEERKRRLMAEGIRYSLVVGMGLTGGILNLRDDRAEFRSKSGQVEIVCYQDVRALGRSAGTLEFALTNGASRSYVVDREIWEEVLDFVEQAIAPHVEKRTVGFDTSFGIDERIEINEERGVFHFIRQGGSVITEEYAMEDLVKCEWQEGNLDNVLGGVLSGGMALLSSAAKAAGAQSTANAEDRIGYVGVALTLQSDQRKWVESLRFGDFPLGMSRSNRKYDRYLAEVSGFMEYLGSRYPDCELAMPVLPEPEEMETELSADGADSESGAGSESGVGGVTGTAGSDGDAATAGSGEKAGLAEGAGVSGTAAVQEQLGIKKYIEGVSGFISECATPMTIVIQGSWGSGRNSILQMLSESLEEGYRENQFWFHAGQFSRSVSAEQLLLQVGNKLISQLGGTGGGAAKDRMIKVTKGLINITSGFISQGSTDGQNFTDALFQDGPADSLEKAVRNFSELIQKKGGDKGKVIIFVDGLDRLAPAEGVELLEAMRDFFDCEGCVFVVAADYSSVIRGAVERYGQDFDEKKGKSFFDRLFQVSFRVPTSGFQIQNYVQDRLEHIGICAEETELEFYVELIRRSVGSDPKIMDRLFNSFLLLKKMAAEELYEIRERRLMLFALLCMQTCFRAVYELIVQMKDKVTPDFLSGLCAGQEDVLSGSLRGAEEKAKFLEFIGIFHDIIDKDRQCGISEAECGVFAQVLEVSGITSK